MYWVRISATMGLYGYLGRIFLQEVQLFSSRPLYTINININSERVGLAISIDDNDSLQ